MKKFLLSLLSLVALVAYGQRAETASFNFGDPTHLTPSVTPDPYTGNFKYIGDQVFTNEGATISFTYPQYQQSAAFIMTATDAITGNLYYRLCITRYANMIISAPSGGTITSITFTGSVGGLTADKGTLTTAGEWTPSGSDYPSSVKFYNPLAYEPQIETITVHYTAPNDILYPSALQLVDKSNTAYDYSDGKTLTSFHAFRLTFSGYSMSVYNASGISLKNNTTNATVPIKTPTASGSTITIEPSTDITTDGDFTLTIASRSFQSSDGYQNAALPAYNFKVREERKTLTKESATITPAEGEVEVLPNPVAVAFDVPIKLNTTIPTVEVYKDGQFYMTANLAVSSTDPNMLEIKYTGAITALGTYTYKIPEGAIHNTAYGTPSAEANDRWNPAFDITYTVVAPADPLAELKAIAAALASQVGTVGYPVAGSAGATQILNVTKSGATPTQEDLEGAIAAFYAETNVILPTKDKWYNIVGVNDGGSKLYLKFIEEGTKVTLTTAVADAAAFKVHAVDATAKTVVFVSKDGLFLHVPHVQPNYAVGGTTLTAEQSDINTMTLNKFLLDGVAAEKLAGTFTLFGSLGMKGSAEKSAYMLYGFDSSSILTDPDFTVADLAFDATKSNAVIFEETTEPASEAGTVKPEAMLNTTKLNNAGDPMTLTITNVKTAVLKDKTKPYYLLEGEKISYAGDILTASASDCVFNVNTAGLVAGNYTLILPAGTFTMTAEDAGKEVQDIDMSASFVVVAGSSTVVIPSAQLTPNKLTNAGDAMVLSINNVTSATLKEDGAKPYFAQNSEPIAFASTILTPSTTDATKFAVNTTGLEAGYYSLVLPAGTFTFTAANGASVQDKTLVVDFTIGNGGGSGGGGGGVTPSQYNFTPDLVYFSWPVLSGETPIRDIDLNDFRVYNYKGWKYNDFFADVTKKVTLKNYKENTDLRQGHFELDTEFSKDDPTIKAYKVVWEPAIKAGDIPNDYNNYPYGMTVGIRIEEGTLGDEHFGMWLNDHSSVSEESCIVNPLVIVTYLVDNDRATAINNVSVDSAKQVIFDLQGRRVQNMDKKGIYIINGRKVVKK